MERLFDFWSESGWHERLIRNIGFMYSDLKIRMVSTLFSNVLTLSRELTKNDQLNLSQELSKKLKQDLQKQKLKTKLVGITGIAVAIGILVIAK